MAKGNAVEIASEMCEEINFKTSNMSSPSEPSEASTWRRRDLVSMVTFRLTTVELIRQNHGPLSSIRMQVAALTCDECAAIPWDELQVISSIHLPLSINLSSSVEKSFLNIFIHSLSIFEWHL